MGGDCGQSPVPSVGDLSYGGGRPGRARPTATSAQPISTQPRPRTNNVLKKKDCFFLIFSDVRDSRMVPVATRWWGDARPSTAALIAQ